MGKKDKTGVGRGILKARSRSLKGPRQGESWRHTSELNDSEDWKRLNISSITEQSALDDFLATAELAGTDFTAEKLNISIVTPSQNDGMLSAEKAKHVKQAQEENKQLLRIPRRPQWTTNMDVQELDLRERESLLEWRRQLVMLQEKEHILLTPFEKNLEFWRQLWRVIERSDVIVQIVDARNPLLFRCEDLEVYVKEKSSFKTNLLLINKADYLTASQRLIWSNYFRAKGICVAFWSALAETDRLQKENEAKDKTVKAKETIQSQGMPGENIDDDDYDEDENDENTAITSRFSELSTDDNETKDQQPSQDNLIDKGVYETNCKQNISAVNCKARNVDKNVDEFTPLDKRNEERTVKQSNQSGTDITNSDDNQNENVIGMEDEYEEEREISSDSEGRSSLSNADKEPGSLLDVSGKILTSDEFIELCQQLHHQNMNNNPDRNGETKDRNQKTTTIGMVGYPNVGKSSTINAILQHKKVSVSATPGKTKHYQTLNLSPSVCLCDCPGLVFPSFVSTKAEMVVNGILPIDQMRDHVPPVSLRIPRIVLEAVYGVNIAAPEEGQDPNRPPYANELLNAYGYMRGYMTSSGTPDCPRSSRYILKDYVKGTLLYCTPPPGVDGVQFQEGRFSTGKFADLSDTLDKKKPELNAKTGTRPKVSSLDKEFFAKKEVRQFVKGTPVMLSGKVGGVAQVTPDGVIYKPWKKHHNRNKKEKLRRLAKN